MRSRLDRWMFMKWERSLPIEAERELLEKAKGYLTGPSGSILIARMRLRLRLRLIRDAILVALMSVKGRAEVMKSAISRNSTETIGRLLRGGFNINGVFKEWDYASWSHVVNFQWTPLSHAIIHDRKPMIEFLLSNGADPNLCFRADQYDAGPFGTALSYAAMLGRMTSVECLLTHGADSRAAALQDPEQKPLYRAASSGHLKIVELLVQHGSGTGDARALQTAAAIAEEKGFPDVTAFLVPDGARKASRPTNSHVDRVTARLLSDEGVSSAMSGNHEEARRKWIAATEADDTWSVPFFNLAKSFIDQRQFQEAERYLNDADDRARVESGSEDSQVIEQVNTIRARIVVQSELQERGRI